MKKDIESIVAEELQGIKEGAGWSTADHVMDYMDLEPEVAYQLMLELAKEKMLFDEDQLTDDVIFNNQTPEIGQLTVQDVKNLRAKLFAR